MLPCSCHTFLSFPVCLQRKARDRTEAVATIFHSDNKSALDVVSALVKMEKVIPGTVSALTVRQLRGVLLVSNAFFHFRMPDFISLGKVGKELCVCVDVCEHNSGYA